MGPLTGTDRKIRLLSIIRRFALLTRGYACVPSYEVITNGGAEFFTQLEILMRKVVGDALEERRGTAREGAGGAMTVGHVIKVVVADVEAALGA